MGSTSTLNWLLLNRELISMHIASTQPYKGPRMAELGKHPMSDCQLLPNFRDIEVDSHILSGNTMHLLS